MYESSDLRKGLKIEIDGDPYIITQFAFVKPGKGQALYKCKLKNMVTGSQFERTYRSGDKFNEANLEEQEMEYLYHDGTTYCFMNTSNYEQVLMTEDQVGDSKNFLKDNTVCNVLLFEEGPLALTPPQLRGLEGDRGGALGQGGYGRRQHQARHPRNRICASGAAVRQ